MCNVAYALLAEGYRVQPAAFVEPEDGRVPDWMSQLDAAVSGER
jgi:hypothetical protein